MLATLSHSAQVLPAASARSALLIEVIYMAATYSLHDFRFTSVFKSCRYHSSVCRSVFTAVERSSSRHDLFLWAVYAALFVSNAVCLHVATIYLHALGICIKLSQIFRRAPDVGFSSNLHALLVRLALADDSFQSRHGRNLGEREKQFLTQNG